MNQCNLEKQESIIENIEIFLSNPKLKVSDEIITDLNNFISVELEEEFDLSSIISQFEKTQLKLLDDIFNTWLGVPASEFLPEAGFLKQIERNDVNSKFRSINVLDLYHGMPIAKHYFEGVTKSKLIHAIILGDKKSDHYTKSNEEVTANLTKLKNQIFKELQEFLMSEGLLQRGNAFDLYKDGEVINYSDYKKIINDIENYFFNSGKFQLIKRNSEREIPNITESLQQNINLYNAYNNAILLVNFDTIIGKYLSSILDIDYNLFNKLSNGLSTESKYKLNIKALETLYWKSDSHESESTENNEPKLAKMLIESIPLYNNLGVKTLSFLETKAFYLFASKLTDFEILHGNSIKEKYKNFEYFNVRSNESLLWYLDNIIKAVNKEGDFIEEFGIHFKEVYDFVLSLNQFLKSPDYNILEKENQENGVSVISVISQILNNTYGASYTIYNANGDYALKQMYKLNTNKIKLQNIVLTTISKHTTDSSFYNNTNGKEKVRFDKLFEGLDNNTNLSEIPYRTKVEINKYLGAKTGIYTKKEFFDNLIKRIIKNVGTVSELKSEISNLLSSLYSDTEALKKVDQISRNLDENVGKYVSNTIGNRLYIALEETFLNDYTVKAVMNIETKSGETLPSFKIANLTYKDTEVLEERRQIEKSRATNFKSLLLNKIPTLLGTGTKLEVVNKDINKSASKFTPAESFGSSFIFDFLKSLASDDKSKNKLFQIQIGAYSDKNSILTKMINANSVFTKDGKDLKIIDLSNDELLELFRTQSKNYYTDLFDKIFSDYKNLFDYLDIENKIVLGKQGVIFDTNINIINKILENNNILELIKKANINDLIITEELHYSNYGGKTIINQYLVDLYKIFNNKEVFSEFVKRQENEFINKFNFLSKQSLEEWLALINKEDLQRVLQILNLPTDVNYNELKIDESLNPLLKKWLWLTNLFKSEYIFLTSKGEYIQPHKTNLGIRSSAKINWEEFDIDMSGRYNVMSKRNVLNTATIDTPIRNTKFGVPEKINHSTIEDYRDTIFNYSGNIDRKFEVHNGGSFIDAVYSMMIDASYPLKGYNNTKKQFGTLITEFGVTIKKDAESIITNERIIASNNSPLKLKLKKQQMLSLNIKPDIIKALEFDKSYNNYFYNELGDQYKIDRIVIKDGDVTIYKSKKQGSSYITTKTTEFKFRTLFDLWTHFGAEFSTDVNGNFNEGSNELLYDIVTTKIKDGYPLKDAIIHVISPKSAIKAGASNINTSWIDEGPLLYATYNNRFMGPQLHAGHEADDSKIKEITQIISALAQNGYTFNIAKEAYNDLANVIKKSAKKYISADDKLKDSKFLYDYIANKFINTILTSEGDNLSKTLIESFSSDTKIPFSSQNFFRKFVQDVVVKMNSDFITRYYTGLGAVLLPSHGIIQVYDVFENDKWSIATQEDLLKRALLNSKNKYLTEDDKIIFGESKNNTFVGDGFYFNKFINFDKDKYVLSKKQSFFRKNNVTEENFIEFIETDVYKNFITDLWNEVKENAKEKNLKLTTSDLTILKNFKSDFDKIIVTDNNLGDLLSTINKKKVIESNLFIEDLIKNNLDIYNDYIQNILKPKEINIDEVQMGDIISVIENNQIISTTSLKSPREYYDFKDNYIKGVKLVKRIDLPRDLKPSNLTFNTESGLKNIFDLDSVKLRWALEFGDTKYNHILEEFKKHFSNIFKDIDFSDNRILSKFLSKWTQRQLQLIENNIFLEDIITKKELSFEDYFGSDTLIDTIFSDVKDFYSKRGTEITNYSLSSAEIILPDIYKSKFKRDSNDSLYDIKSKGHLYFKEKLEEIYKLEKDKKNDIKLYIENLGHPVYVRLVDKLPSYNSSTFLTKRDFTEDSNGNIVNQWFRVNHLGEEVYEVSKDMRIVEEDGKEIILIKGYSSNLNINMESVNGKDALLELRLSNLIKSIGSNLTGFIPLMNNNITYEVNLKNGSTIKSYINYSILKEFSKFSNYVLDDDKIADNNWFIHNRHKIIEALSRKMFATWEKSHELIAARIPSQSMQSFMEMKTVGYLKNGTNDAYVSVWQIFLQGSDFDVDKAYILGSGINSNSLLDLCTNLSTYSTKEQLSALENLPIPTGNKTNIVDTIDTIDSIDTVDVTELFLSFENLITGTDISYGLSADIINILGTTLRKIGNKTNIFIENKLLYPESSKLFLDYIDKHNLYKDYQYHKNSIKNSVVSKIKNIISSPSNQLIANDPVSLEDFKKIANKIYDQSTKTKHTMSSFDILSMFIQQYNAAVGKDDVGIAANGLKGLFSLTTYYNELYEKSILSKGKLRKNYSTFNKKFSYKDKNGNIKSFNLVSISDTLVSKTQKIELEKEYGEIQILFSDAALSASAFTSAATDNAKELLMAKVNASEELSSMHLYLIILGIDLETVFEFMTLPVVEKVINKLETNLFFNNKKSYVNGVIDTLKQELTGEDLYNLKSFESIYNGAQELKFLTRFLGVNQKVSANTEEINRFLSTYNQVVFSRENSIFSKETLAKLKDWNLLEEFDKDNIVDIILKNNSALKVDDKLYIKTILNNASNIKINNKLISLIGGNFDYRYYISNSDYKEIAISYYNLIKDTFNIFDILDKLPHFREMINGVITSHEVLKLMSKKYDIIFNKVRDVINKNANKISTINSNVSNMMGNYNFPLKYDDTNVQRTILYVDHKVTSNWLKEMETSNIKLNVSSILKQTNHDKISMYRSDEAMHNNNDVIEISQDVNEDFNVTLDTNYGRANFKRLMENVILPFLQAKQSSKSIINSLVVETRTNIHGLKGNIITSTFPLGQLSNPINAELFQKLLSEFNSLDLSGIEKIKNYNNELLNWRDLFYIYNLITNNKIYGDARLTALFEDYEQEENSLGYKYSMYWSKIDTGEIEIFPSSEDEEIENDILWYVYHSYDGKLNLKGINTTTTLYNNNPDFIVIDSLTETEEQKKVWKDLRDLMNLIKSNSLIISFEC